MPYRAPLDVVPLWALFLLAVTGILIAHEWGYRLGRARSSTAEGENDSIVGGMVAAELGLLAFLLAFTFGIASSRFDARRQLLLDETNAIGTAYLRAEMLPDPERTEVKRLLTVYVDARIAAVQGDSMEKDLGRARVLHQHLWGQAVSASRKDPRSIPLGLFVNVLNEVIDLHTKRVTTGLRSRIPLPVWVALFAVALLSFAAMGYHGGLSGTTRSPAAFVVALTFAVVLWLVADLDRPGQGWLRVGQHPMLELREGFASASPAAAGPRP